MFKFTLILSCILGAAVSFKIAQPKAACGIAVNSLDPEPIVASVDTLEFLYPDPAGTQIQIAEGGSILISCPGGTLTAGSGSYLTVEAVCVGGTDFLIEGETVNFNTITCSRNPFHTARYTGATCESGLKEVEIGFILSDTSFVRELTLCFDDVLQTTLYSQYLITKSIGHHESGVPRPNFIQDDFWNVGGARLDDIYDRTAQRATINTLVGLPADSTKYVTASDDHFLSRGHLAAKADFVYAPQQMATFHYINVAPQWQTFNGANWNQAEMDTRDYAELNTLDLMVYTGTYGISTLPHETTAEEIPLYIYVGTDGTQGLPVPELYWRVIHHAETKRGVVLLGINNPYQTDINKSIICEDISAQIPWLNWQATNVDMGYSYACNYADFKAVFANAPTLDITDLLS